MATPLATLYTAAQVMLRGLRVQFDNSLHGGRRSLVWDDSHAVDYTSQLVDVGPVRHQTETTLHAYETTDLSVILSNLPTGNFPTNAGFWDQDWTTFALKPLYGINARVSCAVWDDALGDWSAWTPLFTGLVDDVVTQDVTPQAGQTVSGGGQAQMRLLGVPSVLTRESAEDVKNGDAWYEQLPLDQAVKLLLTQKDRFVPAVAPNVPVTVTAVSGLSVTLARSDGGSWSADATGAHPTGVLAGYVLCVTSGTYAGGAYVIATQTGTGSTVVVTLAGSATLPVGSTGYVTGYCYPYLDLSVGGTQTAFPAFHELATMDIQPVTKIPTMDGRYVLSAWDRPPRDGSAGVTELLAHDGTMTWLGVGSRLYRFTETTGQYTLVATLSGGLTWRRAWWWPDSGYVWCFAWADDDTTPERTLYVYRVRPGTAEPTAQSWTTANALTSLAHMLPGDLAYRHSLTNWNQSAGTSEDLFSADAGRINAYDALGNAHRLNAAANIPCFTPQTLRCVDQEAVDGAGNFEVLRGGALFSELGVTWPDAGAPREHAPLAMTAAWTYASLAARSQYAGSLIYARFGVQFHIGGTYCMAADLVAGAPLQGIYCFTRDYATKTVKLQVIGYVSQAFSPVCSWSEPEGLHGPAAIWMNEAHTAVYVGFNVYGAETTATDTARTAMKLYAVLKSTNTPSLAWQMPATADGSSYLLVGGCDAHGMNGVGCILAAAAPGESGVTASVPRQRFLLVQNLQDNAFPTNLGNLSVVLYQSRTPWTHFTQADTDARAWCVHYGYNTLWQLTGGTFGEVTQKFQPTVLGDKTLGSQLVFAPEGSSYRVLGVSAGDLLRLHSTATVPSGKFYFWQFAPWFTPRLPGAWWRGTRWQALGQCAEIPAYTLGADPSGLLHFAPRATSPVDYALGVHTQLVKRRPRELLYPRVRCTSVVGVIGDASITAHFVNVDDQGKPLDGKTFNGQMLARPGDSATRRVRLVCVVGNQATAGAGYTPVTGTSWRVYCASASPQWTGDAGSGVGAAYRYPGGWWNLPAGAAGTGKMNVYVKLEDPTGLNADGSVDSSFVKVGFAPGDSFEITLPGLQPEDNPSGAVEVSDPTAERDYKGQTWAIDNPLVPLGLEWDLAQQYLGALKSLPTVVEHTGVFRPDIRPLDVLTVADPRLGVNFTGLAAALEHHASGTPSTQITVRPWTAAAPAAAQALPTPVPPAPEPA